VHLFSFAEGVLFSFAEGEVRVTESLVTSAESLVSPFLRSPDLSAKRLGASLLFRRRRTLSPKAKTCAPRDSALISHNSQCILRSRLRLLDIRRLLEKPLLRCKVSPHLFSSPSAMPVSLSQDKARFSQQKSTGRQSWSRFSIHDCSKTAVGGYLATTLFAIAYNLFIKL